MQLAWRHGGLYVKCFFFSFFSLPSVIQVVQCNYSLWGKVASGVAIWRRLTHALHRYDYLYGPHWFPDDIMTCNFRKQSPGDEAGCSFESHDFTSLALTLAILYPIPFPHSPIAYIHKQKGNFLEFFLKNPFFWLRFNPFPQSFWHTNGQFTAAGLSEHTGAHIYRQQLPSNKMRGVWCDTGSFLSPDKCTIISLQTQHSAVTVLWEEEIK